MNQAITDCLNGWNSLGEAFCGHAGSAFVQSALLVILLLALDVLWHKRVRAVFRYGVWLLVLLKLILPPTLSLPTGIGYWVGDHLPPTAGVSERVFGPMEQGQIERHPPAAAPVLGTAPAVPPSPEVAEPVAPAAPAIIPPTSLTWQGIVLLFWSAGVLAFVALVAQRLRFVRGLVAASTPAGPELLGLLEQCARQMGVRRPVGLRTLDTLPSPAVCGLRRPTVLMPTALVEKLSPEGLQAALIHELAHIRRADLWINAVQTLLQIIYFYNPFVWLANAVIRRTCEEAVDETVLVTLGGRAKNYSNTLIDISEMAFWKADFGLRLVGVAESKRALQGRIKHMLTRPIPKSARIGTLGAIMILVVAAVLLPMARGTQVGQRETPSLMDRVQREDDPELAEMIRTAMANHPGASEKEILEITRRVTQGRAQILLLDEQIAQIAREIEATGASGETRGRLLLAQKELEAKRQTEIANLRQVMGVVPKVPFNSQPTEKLHAWISFQIVGQQVVVLEALEPFTDYWPRARHQVAGLWSERETLDYVQGRLRDKKNLPIRLDIYYTSETHSASQRLQEKVIALARDARADLETEVRLQLISWVGSGGSPFFLREGKIVTFYPQPARRPDGGPELLASGVVNPNDLEQSILWRLTKPKNVPLTFRIEYDEASSVLAKQVADTVKAVAKRVGLADLVGVTGVLVEPVPEKLFLGMWRISGKGVIQSIEIRSRGVCQVVMGEGSQAIQAGASVRGTWVWAGKEIRLDINDTIGAREGFPSYIYQVSVNGEGDLVVKRGEIWPQGSFMFTRPPEMIFTRASPQSARAQTELAPQPAPERAGPREPAEIAPRSPFGELSTATLNAWVSLQVLEQRVVVLDTLKPFDDQWSSLRHKVVGALSQKETLDYLRGRFQDKKSLPIRVHIYYAPAMKSASEDLGRQIFALAHEANVDRDTEVRLEPSTWVGSGESPFYLREGQIRTFYPRPLPRPDGGPKPLTSGLVDPDDLEQHILLRLSTPKNLPLTFRIEYDQASGTLAKQVADTAKAVAQRVGLSDLVKVAGVLVESVPESAFLGRWQGLGRGMIQSIDIQPGGRCQALVGEGSRTLPSGATVTGTWVWMTREIQLDINDPIPGTWEPLHYAYRAAVDEEGNLVIKRGEIYLQGSFMFTRPPQMIFRKVPPQSEWARTELESQPTTERANLREATGTVPQPSAAQKPEESLNTWLHLSVLDQRVYMTSMLKPMRADWAEWHFEPVGLLSHVEALDYLHTRLVDKSSRPIRIDLHHSAATNSAAAELQGRILALVQETNTQADAEVRLQPLNWADYGTATYYLRGSEIRALYPRSVTRPDRAPRRIASGRIAPEDLEQHVLWRLTFPGNVPVTVKIEYDEVSANLAKQVADTVKATARRLRCAELVEVTGALVEPVPVALFLGRWEAISICEIKTIEVQPQGTCLLTTREGSQAVKPGSTEACPWIPLTQDVIFAVEKDQIIKTPFLQVYRGRVNAEGDLVVDRVGIRPQGGIHPQDTAPMIFRKVQ